ncbi:hypothetical protein [Acanthopleuribacter pedis]|uniref:Uncharacterized protein n=1 Tax=Acanthopleuribacter pedis TaxID=442870 RepID=A0A8J7QD98_9BACT|nr:hypothetical protein [Acanthopleuribacter pedis]MBO1322407.1 hypothetical protein [Acanthopleuribacter pedis]
MPEPTDTERFFKTIFGNKTGLILTVFAGLTTIRVFLDESIALAKYVVQVLSTDYSYIIQNRVEFALAVFGFIVILRAFFTDNHVSNLFNLFRWALLVFVMIIMIGGGKATFYNPMMLHRTGMPEDLPGFKTKSFSLTGPQTTVKKKPTPSKQGGNLQKTTHKRKHIPYLRSSLGLVNKQVSRLVLKDLHLTRALPIPPQITHLELINCSGFENLSLLKFNQSPLQTLIIDSCPDLRRLNGLDAIPAKNRRYLNTLILRNNLNLQDFNALREFPNIIHLELLGSEKLLNLELINNFTLLEALLIDDLATPTDNINFKNLQHLMHLSLKDTSFNALNVFASAIHLQTLEIAYNPLHGFGNIENERPESEQPRFPFNNLTTVKWHGPISQNGLRKLLDACNQVTNLELSDFSVPLDIQVLREKVPQCRELKLDALNEVLNQARLTMLPLQRLSLSLIPSDLLTEPARNPEGRFQPKVPVPIFEEVDHLEVGIIFNPSDTLSFTKFPNLKSLKLIEIDKRVNWRTLNLSKNAPLRRLSLINCLTISDLSFLSPFEKLTHLELESGNVLLKNFNAVPCQSLQRLSIKGKIQIKDLDFLEQAPQLKTLDVQSLPKLFSIKVPRAPKLEKLAIQHCTRLRRIDLGDNPQIKQLTIRFNHDDLLHLQGTYQLKSVSHLSLPKQLKKHRLGSYLTPKQVLALEDLSVLLDMR